MRRKQLLVVIAGALVVLMFALPGVAFASVTSSSYWPPWHLHDTPPGQYICYGFGPLNSGTQGRAQSFKAEAGGTLAQVNVALTTAGGSGPIYAELYNVTGAYGSTNVPTGRALAISAPVDASSITAVQPYAQPTSFNFDNTYQITAGSIYAIAIRYAGAAPAAAYVCFNPANPSAGSHAGNGAYLPSGIWTLSANPQNDMWFQLLVNPPAAPAPATAPVAPGGGTATAGAASVNFPSDATAGTLSVSQCAPSQSPPVGAAGVWVSDLFMDIDYTGQITNGQSATVTLQVPSSYTGSLSALQVWHNVGGEWAQVSPVTVDAGARTLTFSVTSFSLFGLTGPAAPVSTPASSSWSLALLAVLGAAGIVWIARPRGRAAA